MANFGEMSGLKQWAAVVLGAGLVTAGLYFTIFKTQRDQNAAAQQKLEAKQRENAELEAYRPKLAEIERQLIARLLRQPLPSRPTNSPPQQNYLRRLGTLLRDPRTWTSSLYMLLKLPLGIVSFVMALTLPLVSVAVSLFPLVYLLNLYVDTILQENGIPSSSILIPNYIEIHGGFDFATFARTFLFVPLGLFLCLMTYFLLHGLATVSRELAYALLGPSDHFVANTQASMAYLEPEDSNSFA